ncbi:MAG: ktrB [Rhodobacteraceae bacterium]|uniref:TrkH family potassium uptake protein n=1 Tax=Cypionkella sp. TaxID=2811411 RepID=UPI00132ABAEB|nr:potassium transporter TrkG [Cypionkella sp.]KAF0175779.1 MAG: ktrB [Paracoccaceae bacterium]MDO8326440.1 potassium transporter TrkG [Cypionkella sp.]
MGSWLKNPARLVPLAFLLVILLGTAVLMLPMARSGPGHAPLLTALFTATSAVAVTGLAVVDTAVYWTRFGQAVIYLLFQLGGVGIMTSATLLVLLVSRRLSLSRQIVVTTESRGIVFGDVRAVLRLALMVMAVVQGFVMLAMLPHFLSLGLPPTDALWHATFHAGAAFTNAGFSTLPGGVAAFASSPVFLMAVMAAVLVGALGIPVFYDLSRAPRPDRRLSLHSKLTLVTTLGLYLISFVTTLLFEWSNTDTIGAMPVLDRVLNAAYHGFMSRSCGMNTFDMAAISEETLLITYGMMLVGGGSASTAGGLKVTTFAILLLAVWHEVRGNADLTAFGRRISPTVLRESLTVLVLALGLLALGIMTLRLVSDLPLRQVVFEAISAFANVGLSMNATPLFPPAGQTVLIVLMFVGRVGTITLATGLALRSRRADFRYPEERPIVG